MKKIIIILVLGLVALAIGIGARYWRSPSGEAAPVSVAPSPRPPTEEELQEFYKGIGGGSGGVSEEEKMDFYGGLGPGGDKPPNDELKEFYKGLGGE